MVLTVAVVGLVLLALLAYWRLSSGAVSLDWLEVRIEQAVNGEMAPSSVDLEGATLLWNGLERPLTLKFAQLHLRSGDGVELANLEGSSVDLSPTELLRGRLALLRLDIQQLGIRTRRLEDGTFDFEWAASTAPAGEQTVPVFESFLAPPQSGTPLGELTTVRIHQFDLAVEDRHLGLEWGAEDANLEMRRDSQGLTTLLVLDPILDRPLGEVTVDGGYSFGDRGTDVQITFEALELLELARLIPTMEGLAAIQGPLAGRLALRLAEGLALQSLDFDLQGDPTTWRGTLDLAAGVESLKASVTLADLEPWRLAGVREELAGLENVRVRLGGSVDLELEEGRLARASVDLLGAEGEIDVPGVFETPISLGPSVLKGSVENGMQTLRLDELSTTLGPSAVTLQMEAERNENGYGGRVDGRMDRLAVDRLGTYWPAQAIPAARRWVLEHIPVGEVQNLQLDLQAEVAFQDEAVEFRLGSLRGEFDLADLSVSALDPQPPILGIIGRAKLTENRLDFEIDGGRLDGLEIESAFVQIGDFGGDDIDLEIDLTCSTPVAEAIELISSEPLAALDRGVIASDDVSGEATAQLMLSLPLSGDDRNRTPAVSVDAESSGFAWSKAPFDLHLSGGELGVSYRRESLQIGGQVAANGVPVTVDYRATFGALSGQWIDASARIGQADLGKLGLPESNLLTGPVVATVRYAAPADQPTAATVELDFEESALSLPVIDWRKPAGVAGKARVVASQEKNGGWTLKPIDLQAADLIVEGRAQIETEPFRLLSLVIERLDFFQTRLTGKVEEAESAYRIEIAGSHFEINRFLKSMANIQAEEAQSDGDPKEAIRMSIEVDLQEISAGGQMVLERLQGEGEVTGSKVESLSLRAEAAGGKPVELDLDKQEESLSGRLQAEDAGAVMRTFDLTTLFEGGALELTLMRDDEESPLELNLIATDLAMVDSTVLSNVFRLASLDGLLATLEGEGFDFKKIDIDSQFGNGVLEVVSGRAWGQGIGITFEGTADFRDDTWDLDGVVAHMGPLQKAIGKIPGVGKLILGKNKSGILGTEFELTGPLADPEVKVNPFSAFTPGILRDLFTLAEPSKKK